jgi:hypothetical protein
VTALAPRTVQHNTDFSLAGAEEFGVAGEQIACIAVTVTP